MDKFKIGYSVALPIVFAAAMSATVTDSCNMITVSMTGDGTLNLSADSKPVLGHEIVVKVASDGTARTLTFGTGFTAPSLAGTINKTKVQRFMYDGTAFIPVSAAVQIN